jgi:hypothetical protein
MRNARKTSSGMRELVSSTIKLLVFVTIASITGGIAYGAGAGLRIWFGLCAVTLIGQAWASRRDIADFLNNRNK